MRHDQREADQLRPITIQRGFTGSAPGSVLIKAGRTTVLCTASIDTKVPPWMVDEDRGWITGEYSMLPGSTSPRKRRALGGKVDGRSTEIQRLIGRSLRAVADLSLLGQRMITVDCDVLEADGGTRTISTTGALIALVDALATVPAEELPDPSKYPLRDSVAAVSVGIVDGRPVLDLDYKEDLTAAGENRVAASTSAVFRVVDRDILHLGRELRTRKTRVSRRVCL